jgi:protein TonB
MFEQETVEPKSFDEKQSARKTFATRSLTPKSERLVVSGPHSRTPEDPKQRRLMLAALSLLMVALCFVLYRDRDFWFPSEQEAEIEQPAEVTPVAVAPPTAAPIASTAVPAPVATLKHHAAQAAATSTTTISKTKKDAANKIATNAPTQAAVAPETDTVPPPAVVSNRTVLPPLEVEVVAGDNHRTLRPGTNSVRVDLQPGAKPQPANQPTTEVATAPSVEAPETAATVTSNASERVQMSADTNEVVSHPVKPGYPLLARQMKVQGAVILRALISKDGTIQDLHIVSGPRILASAAQDAVRQWRFKPHYVADQAVETQANITVNFTISTN